MNTLVTVPATGPQIAFLNLLLAQRQIDGEEVVRVKNLIETNTLTKFEASGLISDFKTAPRRVNETHTVKNGFYRHGDTLWQVVESKGGNKYAKELVVTGGEPLGCKGHYDILDGSYFECGKPFQTTEQQNNGVWTDLPIRDYGCHDVKNNPPKGTWVYRSGAIKNANLWTPLTLEESAAWGKRTGVCGCCGRTLTKEESIEAGIGPICAGKYF